MEPKPQPSFNWAELDAIRKDVLARAEPERGFTLTMYAKKYGVDRARARTEIQRLLDQGVIERIGMQNFLREGAKGGVIAAVYDFVKNGKKD